MIPTLPKERGSIMKTQTITVKIGIVPSGSGGSGNPVNAMQAQVAREQFGYTATADKMNKDQFILTKEVEAEFPETFAELEAWLNQVNATNKAGERKDPAEIWFSYVDKFYKNKEAQALFARIQGRDSDMTRKFRGSIVSFLTGGALDLEKIDKAIADGPNPSDRFSEDFWKNALAMAVQVNMTGGNAAETIIANLS